MMHTYRYTYDGIVVLSVSITLAVDGGSCQYNSLCSHLCLPKPGSSTCTCPDGLALDANGNQCRGKSCALNDICHGVLLHTTESPDQLVLSKNSTGINLVQLRTSSCFSNENNLNISTSDFMIAIDVEVSANRTYWIDEKNKVFVVSIPLWCKCTYIKQYGSTV